MKSLFAFRVHAFWVPLVCAAGLAIPASAQFGARNGALGGNFASNGMSRPLGGIPTPVPTIRPRYGLPVNRNPPVVGRRGGVFPYAYSFYVPNYFDNSYYGDDSGYPPAPVAAPPAPVPPQQPIIINQYFSNGQAPQQVSTPAPADNNAQVPGGPLGDDHNYYLIAYKNHAVYAALAYWVEDKTLHYVTTQNTHNQASLDLIDLDLTKSLNQARDVPFSIAGK
jgi:hypothetical protein